MERKEEMPSRKGKGPAAVVWAVVAALHPDAMNTCINKTPSRGKSLLPVGPAVYWVLAKNSRKVGLRARATTVFTTRRVGAGKGKQTEQFISQAVSLHVKNQRARG